MSASPPIAVKHWRRSETPLCHNRTDAPQQTAFIQEPSTPRISLAASPEKREYSRHFRSHPGNPG
jgi:hypothetical protein